MRSPPPPTTITPPQLTPPETIDELLRNTETLTAEVLLPDQYDGGTDQHLHEEEDKVSDVTVVETTPVGDPEARPIRQKIPNTRYPANEFDLSLVETHSRRTPERVE